MRIGDTVDFRGYDYKIIAIDKKNNRYVGMEMQWGAVCYIPYGELKETANDR